MHKKDKRKFNSIKLKEKKTRTSGGIKWIVMVTVFSFLISGLLSYLSSVILGRIEISISIIFVVIIVFIGIFADMIGIAVAASDETQFHSMATKHIRGSKHSINMIRHASKVSNFLNDVIGDVCGIISGAVTAMIVVYISARSMNVNILIAGAFFSALVASMTIGGKAVGKIIALHNSNTIVYKTAVLITYIFPERWRKKNTRT